LNEVDLEYEYDELIKIKKILNNRIKDYESIKNRSEHGKIVIERVKQESESADINIQNFIVNWRKYFVEKMQPK